MTSHCTQNTLESHFHSQIVLHDRLLSTAPISCTHPPPHTLFFSFFSNPTVLLVVPEDTSFSHPKVYVFATFFFWDNFSLHLQVDNSPHFRLLFKCHLFREAFPIFSMDYPPFIRLYISSQNLTACKIIYLFIYSFIRMYALQELGLLLCVFYLKLCPQHPEECHVCSCCSVNVCCMNKGMR